MKEIVIIGTGGHAKVVADIVLQQKKFKVVAFLDAFKKEDSFLGLPILGGEDVITEQNLSAGIIAIGDNHVRRKVAEKILAQNSDFEFITAIHPAAVVAPSATIGPGSVLMAGSIVNPDTKIGRHCILNTQCTIDHDGVMHDYSSLAPGTSLGGTVVVGEETAIGVGANVRHGIKIGSHSVIGVGAAVISDFPESSVGLGVPCQKTADRRPGDKYL